MLRHAALFLFAVWTSSLLAPGPGRAQTPEAKPTTEVFTGAGEARGAADRPPTATTVYWRIKAYVKVPDAVGGSRVEMLLPLSDVRQQIIRREERGNGLSFREVGDGLNLRGIWVRLDPGGAADLEYEITAEISDAEVSLPTKLSARIRPSNKRDLQATELVQSDDPEIRRRAKELTDGTSTPDAAAWALFQFAASSIQTVPGEPRADAHGVLTEQRGNSTGKARLLAALLRSLGVPARVVGGLRLEDASKKRATISWVEAQIGEEWIPLDPGGNHFGWLPHDYLALYRGDLPLLVHTAGVDLDYGFIVRQVTREAALGPEAVAGAAPRIETQVGAQQLKTIASYQDKAVASALLIVDREIPENVRTRIIKEAQDDDVNIVILQAASESRYFREQQMQRLVSNNLSLIGGAHLVLIATSDDAGLYALFALGERGVKLRDARVLIGGSYPAAVGSVLGAVLLRLIDAGEVVLVHRAAPPIALWEIARANLLRGVPMVEEARKWDVEPLVVRPSTELEMSRWRRLVIAAWTRAVRAQVPLQALNLILILPVIATIVVVARVLIGIESFGTFAPVIVSLAFITTGLQWGVIIFAVIVTFGGVVRLLLQRIRLQLVSRLAILIATVAGLMAGITIVGASLGVGPLINISIFPMVIMASVIENFAASQFEFGTREAVRLTFNTLLLACLCYLAITRVGLQSMVLAFPEIIAGAILLNVALGKFRGLRLLEYVRFSALGRPRSAS